MKGALFKPVKGALPADALCLLGTNKTFAKRKLVAVAPETGDCDEPSSTAAAELTKRKVMAMGWVSHLVLAPPLIVTEAEIDEAIAALDDALAVADAKVA